MGMKTLSMVSPPTSFARFCMRFFLILLGSFMSLLVSLEGILLTLVGITAHTALAMPLLTVLTTSVAALAILVSFRVYEAYCAFTTLGPGGLPPSISNFVRLASIPWFASFHDNSKGAGHLQPLPIRPGPTPYASPSFPHRQINQLSPEDVQMYFTDRLALFAELQSDPEQSTANVLKSSSPRRCDSGVELRTFGCEARSVLKNEDEGSVHVVLHPVDFEQVATTGWWEVHPLAVRRLPGTLVLVYAPREYGEVCVMKIIEAGARFSEGVS